MRELGLTTHEELHAWSVRERMDFWARTINRLGIRFQTKPSGIMNTTDSETPDWLPGAKFNIVDSCFTADPESVAIRFRKGDGPLREWSVRKLEDMANRVAGSLVHKGFRPQDALAIDMPMTPESIAIYLGIIRMGATVISIADSFAPDEIHVRLETGKAKAVFTQDLILRDGIPLPLYEKVVAANAPPAIVLVGGETMSAPLRAGDTSWEQFLVKEGAYESFIGAPSDTINVLFSSGTTGDPKAIPWTHITPIRSAADGHYHQDIHPGDVVAWPTNLGWMMGPWLIFASLINRATIALFDEAPTGKLFGAFVRDAGVTMLGVVPSMVRAWKDSGCIEDFDWSGIRVFSSTGEASNAIDMLYLMEQAGNAPVIEYCGGTEIGGAYITGTVVRPSSPATFNTLALGIDAIILDEDGTPTDNGELFLIPPSIGLSNRLLNRDHHQAYFENTPTGFFDNPLRRHGDHIERLAKGHYRAHGRVDDTMNIGGIKVSSIEIERVMNRLPGVRETAAIGVSPAKGGPSKLVIIAVRDNSTRQKNPEELKIQMQHRMSQELNPLFKIHDVMTTETLPRTASNKIMRRTLRAKYREQLSARITPA